MSNLRAAQRAMTRQLLMTTALELFENKGYATTTVDDIATAAGTTRATFYAYFPSRSELMKALIDERLNEELQRSRSAERGSTAQGLITAVKEGTREAIGAWMRQTAGHWPAIRPILRIGRMPPSSTPSSASSSTAGWRRPSTTSRTPCDRPAASSRTSGTSAASWPWPSSTSSPSTGKTQTGT